MYDSKAGGVRHINLKGVNFAEKVIPSILKVS